MTSKIYNSIKAIDTSFLAAINPDDSPYFKTEFFISFEESNPQIDMRYICLFEQDTPKALAVIQIIKLGVDVILKNIKISNGFKRFLNLFFCNDHIKIMFCGNVFLSGKYGLSFAKSADQKALISFLGEILNDLVKTVRPLHAIFLKDFVEKDTKYTDRFLPYGFSKIQVEPNMLIHLRREWQSFEDFKAALKSKYRIKVNKADSTSSNLDVKLFTIADLKFHKKDLQELYQNTIDNANFNAQVLNLETYLKLKAQFQSDFIIQGYFLDGELVGFLSALKRHHHLDAHFIGLNYALNKSHAIYPRILNDYIRLGIDKRVHIINLGRTASEIKSTIGAQPTELSCYIKHKNRYINLLIRPLLRRIKIKSYKQHQPFK